MGGEGSHPTPTLTCGRRSHRCPAPRIRPRAGAGITRKDYICLAYALQGSTPVFSVRTDPASARARVAQHRACIKAIANALAGDNGRFDRDRFYRAARFEANSEILPVRLASLLRRRLPERSWRLLCSMPPPSPARATLAHLVQRTSTTQKPRKAGVGKSILRAGAHTASRPATARAQGPHALATAPSCPPTS